MSVRTELPIPVRLLFASGILITSLFWTNFFEPFVFPKFVLLALLGAISLPLVVMNLPKRKDSIAFLYLLVNLIFLMSLVFALVNSEVKFIALFGTQGRNMGFISFLSLVLISLVMTFYFKEKSRDIAVNAFLVSGALVVCYGILQILRLDPFDWVIQFEGILGPFGNPNFMGAFSALCSIAFCGMFLESNRSRLKSGTLITLFLSSVLCIYFSSSVQGWVILLFGLIPVLMGRLKMKTARNSFYWIFGLSALAFGATLGLLQRNFGRDLVSASSAEIRVDFWRIALRMVRDHPWTGVGIERYQNYFREYRNVVEAKAFGSDTFSDSAHNVYLNLAATMGIPASLSYVLVTVFVLYMFLKRIRNREEKNKGVWRILFGIWLGIQIQSLISVDYPTMLFWSHLIAGVLVGSFSGSGVNDQVRMKNHKTMSSGQGLLCALSSILCAVALTPNVSAQGNLKRYFYTVIDSRVEEQVKAKAGKFVAIEEHVPGNPEIPLFAANSLFQDGAFSAAAEAAKRATNIDPHDYRSWWFLASSLESQGLTEEALYARTVTVELSPHSLSDLLRLSKNYAELGDIVSLRETVGRLQEIDESAPETIEARNLLGTLD